MSSSGKYIVGKLNSGEVTALCFNDLVRHDTFKNLFLKIYGAGFFYVNEDGKSVSAVGESISLNVKSREKEDAVEICYALGITL